jgi:hypothetical protein
LANVDRASVDPHGRLVKGSRRRRVEDQAGGVGTGRDDAIPYQVSSATDRPGIDILP